MYIRRTYISDAYNSYVNATGAIFDKTTQLLKIDSDQYAKLQSLYLNIGNRTYEFNANAQIWPRALNQLIDGNKGDIYLIVTDLGPEVSQQTGIVLGMTFFERFYVTFDSSNNCVGLAKTNVTDSMDIN